MLKVYSGRSILGFMLRRLRNPAQAAKAVLALKDQPPTQLEYIALVDELARGSDQALPKPTLDWAVRHLARVTDPLVRHAAASHLAKTTGVSEVMTAKMASLIRSGNVEMALASQHEAKGSELIDDFLADHGILSKHFSEGQWFRAFSRTVERDDYQNARELWHRRKRFFTVPVSEPILSQFVVLVGRYQDSTTLKEVLNGISYDLPVSSPLLAATLNCVTDFQPLIAHLLEITGARTDIELSDFRFVSDRLATNIEAVIPFMSSLAVATSTALGNLVLQGLYRNYTSQLVFHFYRRFLAESGFVPDVNTAQILANSAYRLGNSKLLIYEIWREMRAVPLSRKFYETMLMCQMVGTGFSTTKFVLAEMMRQKIAVRQHIQKFLFNRFSQDGTTASLVELAVPDFAAAHVNFETDLALRESGAPPLQAQAKMNAEVFLHGKDPESEPLIVLKSMLEFERRRQRSLAP